MVDNFRRFLTRMRLKNIFEKIIQITILININEKNIDHCENLSHPMIKLLKKAPADKTPNNKKHNTENENSIGIFFFSLFLYF